MSNPFYDPFENISTTIDYLKGFERSMNNLFEPLLKAHLELMKSIDFNAIHKQMIENVKMFLTKFRELLIEYINSISREITTQTFDMLYFDLPFEYNKVVDSNHSNSPPIKEKNLKEIAIENFHYNMQRYKNHKLIKLIKKKCPTFIEALVFEILLHIIFKALGMQ